MSPRTLITPLTLRRALKLAWATLLRFSGTLRFAKRQLARRNAIVVLTLHRVLDDSAFIGSDSQSGIVVRARTFDALARHLKAHYPVVDLGREMLAESASPGPLRICVTFDDGWLDNYTTAFASLSSQHISATIFICPDLMNKSEPFWPESVVRFFHTQCAGNPERALAAIRAVIPDAPAVATADALIEFLKSVPKEKRDQFLSGFAAPEPSPAIDATMSWDQAAEMSRAGVTFGSHTSSHPILTTLPASEVDHELRASKAAIEARLSMPCACFAYPNGNVNPEVRDLAATAGYRFAFTTRPGAWTQDSDPLQIPRINIAENKLVGARGHFSITMFEYEVFWKAYRVAAPQAG
jgi:peptidoglycan/xylan/chitin deacetylase (PgdA/CDA1 family)